MPIPAITSSRWRRHGQSTPMGGIPEEISEETERPVLEGGTSRSRGKKWVGASKGNHYSAPLRSRGRPSPLQGAASSRPSPRTHAFVVGTRPRGAGRRPSSDSPPDCAVLGELSSILCTAQYVSRRRRAERVAESTPHAPHLVTRAPPASCGTIRSSMEARNLFPAMLRLNPPSRGPQAEESEWPRRQIKRLAPI